MKNLHEITRAILTHEKEEFDKTINGMNDRANSITKFTSVR